MKTQQECLDALAAGKTLTNGQTYVHLDKFGSQILSGHIPANRQHYTFDSPQYWHVYIPHKPENRNLSTYFVIALAFVLGLSVYFYNAYISSEAQCESLQKAHTKLWSEHNILTKKLKKYEADEKYILKLPGANKEKAQEIIKASGILNVSPK